LWQKLHAKVTCNRQLYNSTVIKINYHSIFNPTSLQSHHPKFGWLCKMENSKLKVAIQFYLCQNVGMLFWLSIAALFVDKQIAALKTGYPIITDSNNNK
jgi:hypothetical protein